MLISYSLTRVKSACQISVGVLQIESFAVTALEWPGLMPHEQCPLDRRAGILLILILVPARIIFSCTAINGSARFDSRAMGLREHPPQVEFMLDKSVPAIDVTMQREHRGYDSATIE